VASIHKAMMQGFSTIPAVSLQKLLARKLKAVGIRRFRVVAKSLAEHLLSGSDQEFQWGSNKRKRDIELSFDASDADELERIARELTDKIPDLVGRMTKTVSANIANRITAEWQKMRHKNERALRSFRDSLEDRWGNGFDQLRILLDVCLEMGQTAFEKAQRSKATKGRATASTLIKLHIRACQVSHEILILLENGFPEGAMARWRTLHELSVVALVISDGGDELAVRYRDHEIVETKRAHDRFLEDHEGLGLSPPSARDTTRTNREFAKVLEKHGANFGNSYGWASIYLNNKSPRFIHLEIAAGRSATHSHYKMASYTVHATAKSLTFRVSDIDGEGKIFAGATNGGLDEPSLKLANTMSLITHLLPTFGASKIDSAVELMVLLNIRDQAIKEIQAAARELLREETQARKIVREHEKHGA
jgi:Family of unknown function (DUF5677)